MPALTAKRFESISSFPIKKNKAAPVQMKKRTVTSSEAREIKRAGAFARQVNRSFDKPLLLGSSSLIGRKRRATVIEKSNSKDDTDLSR